jgi:predicted TIM-barrel fold metal-dependent hydrolase
MLCEQALDAFGTRFAICNCIWGPVALHAEDLGAALCRAMNDWLVHEWLDHDPRLRASIVISLQSPELAVEEIERRAADRRFVQVLLLAMGELPLGRRSHWPIYAAAERHRLPIGIHAGSLYRHAPTAAGWPASFLGDYVSQAQAFQAQLLSLMSEGTFEKFPDLSIVLSESGVTWLPSFIWRAVKTWRAMRSEVPWMTNPAEIMRDRVRLTLQPFDAPDGPGRLERLAELVGTDRMFLFSTDYPHWHFDGQNAVPDGLPPALLRKLLVVNALETYPRLQENVA